MKQTVSASDFVDAFRARNRYLTAKGCQRLLSKWCPETEGEPKPHYTVTRVEHAAFGN